MKALRTTALLSLEYAWFKVYMHHFFGNEVHAPRTRMLCEIKQQFEVVRWAMGLAIPG